MKKKRIIPIVFYQNGALVQTKSFSQYFDLGSPITIVDRFNSWDADELIYLNISDKNLPFKKRHDRNFENPENFTEVIKYVSKNAFMPLTAGGKITSLEDINNLLMVGADKIVINTVAYKNKKFIKEASKTFGSQCIVVSIDYKILNNNKIVFVNNGKENTNTNLNEFIKFAEDNGAGEILINSIDRDGLGQGFDIKTINEISKSLNLPLIAAGGAGSIEDFVDTFKECSDVDALAAGNIFNFIDQSVFLIRDSLYKQKINVRKPKIFDE